MPVEIFMPKLGMSMEEGTIVEWLKKKGDPVKKGESVVVISSDKIEKDIEAPEDGVLLEILAEQDETVAVGKVIGYISQKNEVERDQSTTTMKQANLEAAISVETMKPLEAVRRKPRVSPAARKLALEAGIDLNSISGSGPQGRITRADIEKAIQAKRSGSDLQRKKQLEIATMQQKTNNHTGVTVKPITGIRKVIATRMFTSLQQTAQLSIHMRADVTELLEIQKKVRADFLDEHGVKLTITDFIARATILALLAHKQMNSIYQDEHIHTYDSVHLGIAVALENGLIVPVISHAEKLSVKEISAKIKNLSLRAKEGNLESEEMKGSTFTITSLGAYGVEFFTPVLNPPEVGILGVGTVTDTPVFVGDVVQRRSLLPLSLTFDHRVIDGVPASKFLSTIKDYLEKPYKMLI
ncbi:dihydrolipoamide acetyltransferase family protein [Thermaerobacillus caldiproteolyticus]|uniref:Dihydrolipoamide acetyltransferase component of pyruvate dehydrogenase complex n=1 Tax=Thermaerobacillus caldiproteolyticus TaxID=247480 RepID=A0A7W0C0S2_9BACL|nr:dihydrolipoamide acetyltransferase family protein [Anoxybacillus caldiproteolyticus]MBA2876071.1 pyruvate dehydrogenase E2 component (dihydrolipoamide acetyltransferase) [Anoxybacillus caldiproteolyticus]